MHEGLFSMFSSMLLLVNNIFNGLASHGGKKNFLSDFFSSSEIILKRPFVAIFPNSLRGSTNSIAPEEPLFYTCIDDLVGEN